MTLLQILAAGELLLALCATVAAIAILRDMKPKTRVQERHVDVWLVTHPESKFVGHRSLECIPRVGEKVFLGAFVGIVVEVGWLFGSKGESLSVYVHLEDAVDELLASGEAEWRPNDPVRGEIDE